jgi:hypothetical protein
VLDLWYVIADIQEIQTAELLQDSSSLASDCSRMTGDVHTLQKDPPAPDPFINTHWQSGLVDTARLGTDCHTAVTTPNPQALAPIANDSTALINDLGPALKKIVADLGNTNSNNNAIAFSTPVTGENPTYDAWWNAVLGDFAGLHGDLTDISVGAEAHSYSARQAGCRVLTIDAQTLQRDPLPPVPSTSKQWKQSLEDYVKGGNECATGSSTPPDIKELQASNADIAAGNSNMIMVLTATVTGS